MRDMTTGNTAIPTRREFGERIAEGRKARRLSKVKAAEIAKTSDETWGWFELGRRRDRKTWNPSAPLVSSVATTVGLDVAEALQVYGIDPAGYRESRGGRPIASRQELSVMIDQLDAVEYKALEEMVRAILRAKGLLPAAASGDGENGQVENPAAEPSIGRRHKLLSGVHKLESRPVLGPEPSDSVVDGVERGPATGR